MSSKQDRTYTRTAADLERKYNFGRSFAEILGIANDAQTHATKAEELAKKVQAQLLEIDVVEELNVSAGTITLKSKGLSIVSDGLSLSADKGITATKGNIGLWDISEKGISKNTDNYFVKMNAPEDDSEDVITVAEISNGTVNDVKFCVKGNGEIFAKSGRIANWKLNSDNLEAYFEEGDDSYLVLIGSGLYENSVENSTSFYVNKNGEAVFYVRPTGYMFAKNAHIEGDITALSGSIGGFTIDANRLYSVRKYGESVISPSRIVASYDTLNHDGSLYSADIAGVVDGVFRYERLGNYANTQTIMRVALGSASREIYIDIVNNTIGVRNA